MPTYTTHDPQPGQTSPYLTIKVHTDPEEAAEEFHKAGKCPEGLFEQVRDLFAEYDFDVDTLTFGMQYDHPPRPGPKAPEGTTHDIDGPDGWTDGRTRHTGGNIWCREFYTDGTGKGKSGEYIVAYDAKWRNGVSLMTGPLEEEYEDGLDYYIHEDEVAHISLPDDATDEDAVEAALSLIARFNAGEFDN